MKIVTEQELQEFDAATRNGGIRGLAYGLGLSIPGSLALQRWSPRFRALPLPLKAFGVVMITSASTVVVAERAGLRFDKERYSKSLYGSQEIQRMKEERAAQIQGLGTMQRATHWLSAHKYSVILGSWATSMVGAWAVISRDKYMTFSQKIVQVRMWAQGVTIAMIIGTAIISQADRQKAKDHPNIDHSWMSQIGESPENSKVQKVTTS